jgi:hypothetical protein
VATKIGSTELLPGTHKGNYHEPMLDVLFLLLSRTVSLSQASRCTEIAWQVRANSLSKRCLPDRLMSPRPRKYPGLGVWTQVPISGHAAIFSVHDSPGSTSTPVWLVLRLLYLFPLKMVSAFKTFGVFSLAAGCRFLQSVND